MNIEVTDKENCCGCTACLNICPQKAIHMERDVQGFYYPMISVDKCVKCRLCEKICSFSHFEHREKKVRCFAVRHKNANEVESSRSGAFFSVLVDYVLSCGGVVCGAALGKDLIVRHTIAETKEGCIVFKGSKYVQSYISDELFRNLGNILLNGRWLLFSGTGCQVHGFLGYCNYNKIDKSKLITVDFVCHGVPSPSILSKYIAHMEKHLEKKIVHINFRDKSEVGWSAHLESYEFSDGSKLGGGETMDGNVLSSLYVSPILLPLPLYNTVSGL